MPVLSTTDPGLLPDSPEVSVTVGPLTGDFGGKFTNEGASSAAWDDYLITNRYEKSQCRYMMGVTSPDGFSNQGSIQKVAFAQLASPTLLWMVDFTAMRTGQKPNIPNPNVGRISQKGEWILLSEHLEPLMVTLAADGDTPIYRISGTYIYGNTAPDFYLSRDINFPRAPWLENSFDRTVPDNMFENALSNLGGVG